MKSNSRVLLLLLLISALFVSGCWSYKSIEHLSYVHSIGVDYKDGKYVIYAQFPNFTNISKVEGAGQSEGATPIFVGKGVGETYNMALYDLYRTLQRRLYWSHLSTIVLSETVVQKGMDEILDLFQRFGEFRPTFWVYTTNEKLENIFLATHVFDPSPVFSKLGDPIDMNKQDSYPILPKRMYTFMAQLREPSHTMIIPSMGIAGNRWFDEKKKFKVMLFNGYSVVKNGKWKGRMSYEEAQGLLWINRELVRSPLTIRLDEKSVFTVVILKPEVKIKPIVEQDEVRFAILIQVEGHVTQLKGKKEERQMVKAAVNRMKKQIDQTYQTGLEMDADVLNLSDTLYRTQPQIWKKFAKHGELPLTRESLSEVKIDLELIHFGKKVRLDVE